VEALGVRKFSVFTDFGFHADLAQLSRQYQDYFDDKITQTQNDTVKAFVHREYDSVRPTILEYERLRDAPFKTTVGLSRTVCDLNEVVLSTADVDTKTLQVHTIFNEHFGHIDEICLSGREDEIVR
jgi:hypothetical protein